MTANEDAVIAAEKLAIQQKLVNRIVARAVAEGKPLTSIQTRQFETDSMSKEEYWKFDEEFKPENEWQDFMDRISGLLRSAIAEDAANDPDAPARYDAMVHKLEDRPESFTLWACCVPAISGYKSVDHRTTIIVWLGVLAVIVFVFLHALRIL
jgi:hypothetical protein